MIRNAVLSYNGRYRYLLSRLWDESLPRVLFVGANPATADDLVDDQTVMKYIGFAQRGGYGGYWAANLRPQRQTLPELADRLPYPPNDPSESDAGILFVLQDHKLRDIICAWGDPTPLSRIEMLRRAAHINELILRSRSILLCAGTTKAGNPKHLSRLGYAQLFQLYEIHPLV